LRKSRRAAACGEIGTAGGLYWQYGAHPDMAIRRAGHWRELETAPMRPLCITDSLDRIRLTPPAELAFAADVHL
jgi:hypothetical protein